MKKGAWVQVFEHPFTQEGREGDAQLLEHVRSFEEAGHKYEDWFVRFRGVDEPKVYRTIRVQ